MGKTRLAFFIDLGTKRLEGESMSPMSILVVLLKVVNVERLLMTKETDLPLVTRLFRWWGLLVCVIGGTVALVIAIADYANSVFHLW